MKFVIAAMAIAVALVACGGEADAVSTPTLTEGLYLGRSVNLIDYPGHPTSMLVLEQKEIWVLEGLQPPVFFGKGTFEYTGNGTVPNGSTADVYTQGKALVALDSSMLGERPMTLNYVAHSTFGGDTFLQALIPSQPQLGGPAATLVTPPLGFDYDKPASLADVAGAWRGITIYSTGAVTGTDPFGACTLAGTVTPRPTGKNVFNLRLTVTKCPDAGEYTGVAFNYADYAGPKGLGRDSTPTFRLMSTNSDKTKMFALTTTK